MLMQQYAKHSLIRNVLIQQYKKQYSKKQTSLFTPSSSSSLSQLNHSKTMLRFQKYPSINKSQQQDQSSLQQKQNSIGSKQQSSYYLNERLKCRNSSNNNNSVKNVSSNNNSQGSQKVGIDVKDVNNVKNYGSRNQNIKGEPSASSIATSDQCTHLSFAGDNEGGPTLFQFELRSHNLRKQQEHFHNKTVHEYFKRKKQIVQVANQGDKKRRKIAEVQNKMRECSKNTQSNWKTVSTYLEGVQLQSQPGNSTNTFSKSLRRSTEDTIFKNSHLSQLFKTQHHNHSPFDTNFLQKSTPSMQNQFHSTSWLAGNNINKRQVYLSNISNLNQLRKSLSYSRSKFNRKIIKMDREIGKNYVQFQDRLLGSDDCVKGIFL